METQEFDRFAENYRATLDRSISSSLADESSDVFSEYKVNEIIDQINEGARLLDFGCGDGISSFYFSKARDDIHYYGIDVSGESIRVARKKYSINDHAQFSIYDGKTIPYEDNCFDVVFTACVFHHICTGDRQHMLDEIYRVLRPGGVFYVFEHNPINPITQKIVHDCPFDEGVVLISPRQMRKMLYSSGWLRSSVSTRYTVFFPRKKMFNKVIRLEKGLYRIGIGGQYYCICKKGFMQ